MSKIKVLVFPAESGNATEIHDALSSCVGVEVWGASSVERHGPYVYKNYVSGLPKIDEEDFYEKLSGLVVRLGIDVVIPTHDTVVLEFAENIDRIPAKVLVPQLETAEACRSKKKAYSMLKGLPFVPRVFEAASEVDVLPVFAKPDEGQGARGARVIRSVDELAGVDFENNVVTEYLPGREFTVDCLTDGHGDLVVVSPRERARIENGVSARARTFAADVEVKGIAEAINSKLSFCGLWFFQVKEDANGALKLMEVSGRCAGTMCATRAKGYNLPLMSVYVLMGREVDAIECGYEVVADRQLSSSYRCSFDMGRLVIDYDDTIVHGREVDLRAIQLLFQCRNKGIPIVLVTRHEGDLEGDMAAHGISVALFDSVVRLSWDEQKTSRVEAGPGDVFVDNAFAERKAFHDAFGVPVFDVSEIPVLLDTRF